MTVNWGQVLALIVVVGGVLVGASSQLSDLGLDAETVKQIVAAAGLAVAICGGILTKFQSNYSQALSTSNVRGVSVAVNARSAPQSIVQAARDPENKNINLEAK